MTVASVGCLVFLGMPLPGLTELASINSLSSFSSALFPTLTKGIGLMGQYGIQVGLLSFMGGWFAADTLMNAFKGRGFAKNTLRSALRVTAGTAGLSIGAFAGTWLASKFSSMAAAVHNPGAILKNFYDVKPTGFFSKPEVTMNIGFDSTARALVENLQQGWSVFWQGIGSGVSNPDFLAAAALATIVITTTASAMNPRRAVRVTRRLMGYRPA